MNEDHEVFPANAVINYFGDNSLFSLLCLSTEQNADLRWESRNVSRLSDGEIIAGTLNELNISAAFERRLTTLSIRPFVVEFTGYYSCISLHSSIEVYATPTNPLWELISPIHDYVPMGAIVTLVIRHADSSTGYGNRGNGFNYTLHFLPCVASLPDQVLATGISSRNSSRLMYMFRARLMQDSGEFLWNGT